MLWAVFCVIIVKFEVIFALNIILVLMGFTLCRPVNRCRHSEEEQFACNIGNFNCQQCETSQKTDLCISATVTISNINSRLSLIIVQHICQVLQWKFIIVSAVRLSLDLFYISLQCIGFLSLYAFSTWRSWSTGHGVVFLKLLSTAYGILFFATNRKVMKKFASLPPWSYVILCKNNALMFRAFFLRKRIIHKFMYLT
jgi:hypothetical protein